MKPKPATIQKQPQQTIVEGNLKARAKLDYRMQNLERLHERTSVKANIHLPEGRRIKVDDGIYVNKPKATFDMDFTELDTGDRPEEPEIACLSELSDDSDELPAVHELLHQSMKGKLLKNSKKAEDSSSNYDDFEMDDLIRNAPSPIASAVTRSNVLQEKEVLDLSSPVPSVKKRTFDEGDLSDNVEEDPKQRSPKRRKVVPWPMLCLLRTS